ncbi:MAG: hypothetical protein ACYC3I_15465 [Gemmataceae bacterium]
MTPLGKPLVFYLKYLAEMNRLYGDPTYYGGEEPDLTELAHAEQVREKAQSVGAAAYEQVADFLLLCGRRIEEHFTGLGVATLTNKRTRTYVVRNWVWGARVNVSSVTDGWFFCGAYVSAPPEVRIALPQDVCGIVVPWLWSRGGRKGEDAIWKVVGSWADSRGGERVDNDRGTVTLSCIPLKPEPPESFDVDRDLLIAEVMKTIARIGAEETKAIATVVAGLKESEEG